MCGLRSERLSAQIGRRHEQNTRVAKKCRFGHDLEKTSPQWNWKHVTSESETKKNRPRKRHVTGATPLVHAPAVRKRATALRANHESYAPRFADTVLGRDGCHLCPLDRRHPPRATQVMLHPRPRSLCACACVATSLTKRDDGSPKEPAHARRP